VGTSKLLRGRVRHVSRESDEPVAVLVEPRKLIQLTSRGPNFSSATSEADETSVEAERRALALVAQLLAFLLCGLRPSPKPLAAEDRYGGMLSQDVLFAPLCSARPTMVT